MIFGLRCWALILYFSFISDAIVTKLSFTNENTTSTPFRLRLRWPSRSPTLLSTTKNSTFKTTIKRPTASTTTIPSSTKRPVFIPEKSAIPLSTERPIFTTTEKSTIPLSTKRPIFTTTEKSTIPLSTKRPIFTTTEKSTISSSTKTQIFTTSPITTETTSLVAATTEQHTEVQTENQVTVNPFSNFIQLFTLDASRDETDQHDFHKTTTIVAPLQSVFENWNLSYDSTLSSSFIEMLSTKEEITEFDNKNDITTLNPEYETTKFNDNAINSDTTELILKHDKRPQYNTNTSTSTVNEVQVSTGGTYVYVVGIVGVIPTVGVFMWCVRQVLSRSQKIKEVPATTTYSTVELPSNESRENDVTTIITQTDQTTDKHERSNLEKLWKRSHLEYPRHNLELQEILGEGNFGIVWKAEAKFTSESRRVVIVAVKTVKENATFKERQELLRELYIMQHFDLHPNVVKLLGCCTETEPYFLIMEFVKKGKLQSFLREHRTMRKYYNSSHTLTSTDLTLFAYQVATGMEYISSVGVIHRDLAARNILVDHNNVCKVADFGLSRYFEDPDCAMYEQKTKGALPIRWMAPESLYMNMFTTKSDVWAFGILLWEIVTLGSTPYPGMGARDVMHYVQKGNIMECPNHCHPELYSVMCECWATDPNHRPTFTVLCQRLGNLLEVQAGYVDLDHFPENSYYNLYQSPGEKV